MCFQQLPRIIVDFDFSHGVSLLLVRCDHDQESREP
jgi:hypothetical protein